MVVVHWPLHVEDRWRREIAEAISLEASTLQGAGRPAFRLQAPPPIDTCANSERALGSCWSLGRASTSGWSGSCTAPTRTRPSSQPPSSTNVSPNPSHRSPLALSILLQLTCIILFLPFSFIKLQPLHQPRRASFGLSRHRYRAYASRRIVGLSAHSNPAPQQIARRPSHPVRLSRCRYVSALPCFVVSIQHRASSFFPRLGGLFIAVTHTRFHLQISNLNL